VANLT